MLDRLFRSFPPFKGKYQLAQLLLSRRLTTKNKDITGTFGCKYILPNLIEPVGFEIFINGQYEPETISIINKMLPPKGRFLDIGANIGAILIPLCVQRPDIKAIAVEASPWIFNYLAKNVALNKLQNVQLANNALCDKDDILVDFFAPEDKFGKGSLSPVFTQQAEKIKARTIDSLIKDFHFYPIDVIKIDVEGFEYFVFKGGSELLQSDKPPFIIFEFVDWAEEKSPDIYKGAAQDILLSFGYKLFMIKGESIISLSESLKKGAFNLLAIPPSVEEAYIFKKL